MMVRSFLETPIPPGAAYSPATVAHALAEGLQAAGHEVTFFGPEGTSLDVANIETCNLRSFFTSMEDFDDQIATADLFSDYRFAINDGVMARAMLSRAKSGEFDVVVFHHFESAVTLAPLYPEVQVAYILHDFMDAERSRVIQINASDNQHFISISDNQRQFAPDLNYAATVYNGIDIEAFTPAEQQPDDDDEYLLFSGRISPDKGVKEAVQVALHSKHRLLIAGNLSKQDYWYFDEHVKPYLDDKILFLGMLDKAQLIKYYQKAKALLVPIQWEEPFGLTMAEANACGTPVIAFQRGAVPELIIDGKNGFIVNNTAEMIMAVEKLGKINRDDCREHAVKNFSIERMVDGYDRALAKITSKQTAQIPASVKTSSRGRLGKNLSRLSKGAWRHLSQ